MPADNVIKHRLATLRDRKASASKKAVQARAETEHRAEENGVSIDVQRAIDRPNTYAMVSRTMPMSFYYGQDSVEGRDATFVRRRATFYTMCARVFGFSGWHLEDHSVHLRHENTAGRDGRDMLLMPIDQSQAVNLNANAAPLEFLVSQNWLASAADPKGFAMLRWAVALHFRDVVQGSQSGGLKAQAYEGGGGGFGPRLVSDYALDCMAAVSKVRSALKPDLFSLIHHVIVDDMWVWEDDLRRAEKMLPKRAAEDPKTRRRFDLMKRRLMILRRNKALLQIHKAIDAAAVAFDYMSEDEYRARWVKPKRRGPSSPR